jgi:hypothetical protein
MAFALVQRVLVPRGLRADRLLPEATSAAGGT